MSKKSSIRVAVKSVAAICSLFLGANYTSAAEIKLLASANAAMVSALSELAPKFEQAAGHKVILDFASAGPLKKKLDSGEQFDILIAPGLVDDLVAKGKISKSTRVVLASTGLGVGVFKGTPRPDISSVDAFKRTLLNAKSIATNPDSEPGVQFLEIANRLGIAPDVRARLKNYRTSAEMGAALEKKEVELVVSSVTNLFEARSQIDIVSGFPTELQKRLEMVGGVNASSKQSEAAQAMLNFLATPAASQVFKAKGFEGG